MITVSFERIDLHQKYGKMQFVNSILLYLWNDFLHIELEGLHRYKKIINQYLHKKEKEQLSTFRLWKRKLEFLEGRIAVKKLINKYEQERGRNLEGKYNKILIQNIRNGNRKGMPFIAESNSFIKYWPVSISHTQDIIFTAIANKCRVGVDVENIFSLSLAENSLAFTPIEQRFIFEFNPLLIESSLERATLLWCCKEAIGKSFGIGFHYGLKSFCFENFDKKRQKIYAIVNLKNIIFIQQGEINVYYNFIKDKCFVIVRHCIQ